MTQFENINMQDLSLILLMGATGPFEGATVNLFTNPSLSLTKSTLFATFVEPTFTGYTPAALGARTIYLNSAGVWEASVTSKTIHCTGGTPTDTITGVVIVNAAANDWLVAAKLDTPIAINAVGKGLVIQPLFTYPPGVSMNVQVP